MYFLAYSHITLNWYIVDFQSKTCIWIPYLPFIFLYNVWQVTSFPWVLIRHLSNSNNNIFNGRLGCRFDFMSKNKAFHEMPGKCEIVNSLTHLHPTGLYISRIRNHLFYIESSGPDVQSMSVCWINKMDKTNKWMIKFVIYIRYSELATVLQELSFRAYHWLSLA